MINNIKIFLLCPVPEDQKPINVYIGLKENVLTNWTTLSKKNYEQKLISIFLSFFLIISLGRIRYFEEVNYLIDWLLFNCFLSFIFLSFLLFVICFSFCSLWGGFMLYAHMVRRHDNCFGVSFGICARPPRRPATGCDFEYGMWHRSMWHVELAA